MFKYEMHCHTAEVSVCARTPAAAPSTERVTLELIPYFAHANRGETDMKVWFVEERG